MNLSAEFKSAKLHGGTLRGCASVCIDSNEDGNIDSGPHEHRVDIEDDATITLDDVEYTAAFAKRLITVFVKRAAKTAAKADVLDVKAMPIDVD